MALDEIAKSEVCKMTGKEDYEFGDLSKELDSRVKTSVAAYCGKEEYQVGDLSREVDRRVKQQVIAFTGKGECEPTLDLNCAGPQAPPHSHTRCAHAIAHSCPGLGGPVTADQFGDVSRELNQRRAQWVQDFLGTQEYEFGDITKK